ncbi:hypothetical protein AV654_19835 [Paenibacillus elgii]|uniref:Uncharacterized protein n=1 Tax=Paenibacillus elgii TaxID=189691 RepID=A0A163XPG4_9BACL|nr:hypothetical protein [Paenibacillus elgii]KZE78227.1 hypothetical protein AV654_19835 [Paenibacillus elgii]
MENKDMQSRDQSPYEAKTSGQSAPGEEFQYPMLEDVADKGDVIRDEPVKMLAKRKLELKSLEEYPTDNPYVQRLIHNRVVELSQEIRSLEEMFKSSI